MGRRGLTTEHVALAGAELADEVGADQVTITRVARRLGVQPPSLYAHVRGSEDLQAQVTALALEELADAAAATLVGRSGREAVRAYAEVLRTYATEHPGRYTASRRAGAVSESGRRAGRRHAELLAALLRGYGLAEPAHVHATRLVASTVHGFISLQTSGSFDHSDPPAQETWEHVIDALDATLTTWAQQPPGS